MSPRPVQLNSRFRGMSGTLELHTRLPPYGAFLARGESEGRDGGS